MTLTEFRKNLTIALIIVSLSIIIALIIHAPSSSAKEKKKEAPKVTTPAPDPGVSAQSITKRQVLEFNIALLQERADKLKAQYELTIRNLNALREEYQALLAEEKTSKTIPKEE